MSGSEKKADALVFPALVAGSLSVSALRAVRETRAKKLLLEALKRHQVAKAKAVVGAGAVGIAGGAALGYGAGKREEGRKHAFDIFGHPLGFIGGGIAGEVAGRAVKAPMVAPVAGAIIGGQIAKAKFAPKAPKIPKEAAVKALRRMVEPMVRKGPWLAAAEKKPMGREALLETILGDVQATAAGK